MQPITRYRIATAIFAALFVTAVWQAWSFESQVQSELRDLHIVRVTFHVIDAASGMPLAGGITIPGPRSMDERWPRCGSASGGWHDGEVLDRELQWASPFPISVTFSAKGYVPQTLQLDHNSEPHQTIRLQRDPNAPPSASNPTLSGPSILPPPPVATSKQK